MAPVPTVKPGSETETSAKKKAGVVTAEKEQVELDGRRGFFKLRSAWSSWIITWITLLIIFNVALTILIGSKILIFEDYKWFVTGVTFETFLQIVGMGYIAVKYFFSDRK